MMIATWGRPLACRDYGRPAAYPTIMGTQTMNPQYVLQDPSSIYTPALLFYKDIIRSNIATIVRMAGSVARLRPHVKTHKTREIVRMELDAGITKHKCATIAEAE